MFNYTKLQKFTILPQVLLLFLTLSVVAKPSVERMRLQSGNSPRITRFSWATLKCSLKNPDKTSSTIEIRLIDKFKGAYKQKNVFSDVVTIPPETQLNYRTMVVVEDAEEYHQEGNYHGQT